MTELLNLGVRAARAAAARVGLDWEHRPGGLGRLVARLRVALVAGWVLVLGACGGGADLLTLAGGVGSGGSGLAGGTVTGFGSVVVDGQAIPDNEAFTVEVDAQGQDKLVALSLGEQVRITLGVDGSASRIERRPTLVGPVQAVDTSGLWLRVLGQAIQIGTGTLAPQWAGGPLGLDALRVGQWVAVHARAAAQGLQATRIQALDASPDAARLSGIITRLDRDGAWWVGDLALLPPVGAQASVGQRVTVWGPLDDAGRLRVQRHQIDSVLPDGLAPGSPVVLSGRVDAVDAAQNRVVVDGLPVLLGDASALQGLAAGDAVQFVGVRAAHSTLVLADRITRLDGAASVIQLTGQPSAVRDQQSLVLRQVAVDLSDLSERSNCPATGIDSLQTVVVQAVPQAGTGVLKALALRCTESHGSGADKPRSLRGQISQIDPSRQTLWLRAADGSVQVLRWRAQTVFGKDLAPTGLLDVTVIAEVVPDAQGSSAAWWIRELRLPGGREVDAFDPRSGDDRGWSHYDEQFRKGPQATTPRGISAPDLLLIK